MYGPSSNRNIKGLNAQLLSGLEGADWRSVGEQDLHEVVGGGGKRVHAVHFDLNTVVVKTLQFLLRGVVGYLDRLGLSHRCPERHPKPEK
jgi:hypothetical protein